MVILLDPYIYCRIVSYASKHYLIKSNSVLGFTYLFVFIIVWKLKCRDFGFLRFRLSQNFGMLGFRPYRDFGFLGL